MSFKITFLANNKSKVIRQWDEWDWQGIAKRAEMAKELLGLKVISIELLEGK